MHFQSLQSTDFNPWEEYYLSIIEHGLNSVVRKYMLPLFEWFRDDQTRNETHGKQEMDLQTHFPEYCQRAHPTIQISQNRGRNLCGTWYHRGKCRILY